MWSVYIQVWSVHLYLCIWQSWPKAANHQLAKPGNSMWRTGLLNICMGKQRQRCEHNPPVYTYMSIYIYIFIHRPTWNVTWDRDQNDDVQDRKVWFQDDFQISGFHLKKTSCARISLQKEKCQDLSLGSTNNSQASRILQRLAGTECHFFGTSNFETETDLQSIGRIQGVERVATLVHEMYPNISIPWWSEFH